MTSVAFIPVATSVGQSPSLKRVSPPDTSFLVRGDPRHKKKVPLMAALIFLQLAVQFVALLAP
jgi:hypothetical protein